MDADKQADILRQVITDVLERFAFSFAEDEEPQFLEGEYLLSDLAFTGPVNGKVRLALSRELAAELGVNILGVDPNTVTASLAEDTIKELSNIICGDLLYHLYGPQAVFDLCVPSFCVAGHLQTLKQMIPPDATVVDLSVEGHRLTAWLELSD